MAACRASSVKCAAAPPLLPRRPARSPWATRNSLPAPSSKPVRWEKPLPPCKKIGIGRSLAAPPSHTTWHTGPYQGGSVSLHVTVSTQSEQTHPIKELIVERHAYARSMTDLPRSFRTPSRRVGQCRGNPVLDQLCLASAIHLPVFPLEAAQP